MRRWPLILLTLAIVIVGGRYIYGAMNKPDDKTLIQQALAEAIKASKEGRPGSVIDKLVDNFTVNGTETSKRQIADFVKNNHPEVDIKDTDPLVSGDTAQITSDVAVKVQFLGNQQGLTFKDAQILFKKESAMDWLIFPTTKWSLSAVRVKEEDMPNIPMP